MHAFISAAFSRLGRTRVRSNFRSSDDTCGGIHACETATYHALCWKTSPSWDKFRVPNCGLAVSRSSLSTIVAMFENAPAKWRGHVRFRRRQTCRRKGRSLSSRANLEGPASRVLRAPRTNSTKLYRPCRYKMSLSPLFFFFHKSTISFVV